MSSWFAWGLSVVIVVLALLYVSPKLRKTAFIWFTYISLTGWYYFRLWEKKRARSSTTATSTNSSSSSTPRSGSSSKLNSTSSSSSSGTTAPFSSSAYSRSSRAVRQSEPDIDDVVYFEPADVALQQRELRNVSERSARLSGSSSSGNSGYSDDSLAKLQKQQQQHQPKSHLGIFRSMRKLARESEKQRRDSEFSNPDPLARSSVSEPGTTTRRTYTGRKKPQSWAD